MLEECASLPPRPTFEIEHHRIYASRVALYRLAADGPLAQLEKRGWCCVTVYSDGGSFFPTEVNLTIPSRGFRHFVTTMPAPFLPAGAVAGWGLHPLEKRRIVRAHVES